MRRGLTLLAAVVFALTLAGCSKATAVPTTGTPTGTPNAALSATKAPIVTFIELGSVNCIPCKAMQPVMESIRTKYPDQVSVLFYDVWTKEGQPYGQRYGIRVIPTQVFLDKDGKEYYRHEGFFPEEELLKILGKGGVKL
jgi:thioredoxin 1